MRLALVAKPLLLISALVLLRYCHSFHISFNNVENPRLYSRLSSPLGQCMTWVPQSTNYQRLCCVLNESDKRGIDQSDRSTKHRAFLRSRFSIFKYPGVVWKYLRQRLGTRRLGRNISGSSCFQNENGTSNVVVDSPTLSSTSSEIVNGSLFNDKSSMDRCAYSAPHVNLTGSWNLITSDDFLKEYDLYLRNLGQPYIVRSIAISIIDRTTEETLQMDRGRLLLLRSINARGVWERTLVGSGKSLTNESSIAYTTIFTADKEPVQAEAWWEENGTVHHSWLRGVTKYGGGDFESIRYLAEDDSILVCESIFHPYNRRQDPARIQWRFRRCC